MDVAAHFILDVSERGGVQRSEHRLNLAFFNDHNLSVDVFKDALRRCVADPEAGS